MIVAYDAARGEPRAKGVKDRLATAGDCVDCGNCVTTCPTGIDIRDGLQMECIHCTQCADACDAVMAKVGKPRGLIRYTSRELLAGEREHWLRPRTVAYPALLAVFVSAFAYLLSTKSLADVTLLAATGSAYSEEADGRIANQVRVKIANRSPRDERYTIEVVGADGGQVIIPLNPFPVKKGASDLTSLFVILPRSAFRGGTRPITVKVRDDHGFTEEFPFRLLGPEIGDDDAGSADTSAKEREQ